MGQSIRKPHEQHRAKTRSHQGNTACQPRSGSRYYPQRKRGISSCGLTGSQCRRQKKPNSISDPPRSPLPVQRNLLLFHSLSLLYAAFSSSLQYPVQESRRNLERYKTVHIFQLQSP
jgi:hypothetical protein